MDFVHCVFHSYAAAAVTVWPGKFSKQLSNVAFVSTILNSVHVCASLSNTHDIFQGVCSKSIFI